VVSECYSVCYVLEVLANEVYAITLDIYLIALALFDPGDVIEVVDDYPIVSFHLLEIDNKESLNDTKRLYIFKFLLTTSRHISILYKYSM